MQYFKEKDHQKLLPQKLDDLSSPAFSYFLTCKDHDDLTKSLTLFPQIAVEQGILYLISYNTIWGNETKWHV